VRWSGGLPVRVETMDPDLGDNDVMQGDAGDDIILGGTGSDRIDGDSDRASANTGNDVIVGDQALVLLFDLSSPASPALAPGATMTTGRAYWIETTVRTNGGRDRVAGGPGEDILVGGANGDFLDGDAGNDLILGDNAILDRTSHFRNFAGPRFRALATGTIYDLNGGVNTAITGGAEQLDPRTPAVWADYRLTLLDHDLATQTAAQNNFGSDQIAGGPQDDTIFGELGDDIIQGDGDLKVEDDLAARPPDVNAYRDPTGALVVLPSFEAATDGDDYIEGNGGHDVVFGGLGQDDIIGGSSSLFSLASPTQRPDVADLLFGGAGTEILRNHDGNLGTGGHARDADVILGDNGNIYRLVSVTGGVSTFRTFNYDTYAGSLRIVPRAAQLLDYTPGGFDYDAVHAATDLGGADEIHGESGDDAIYGMAGNDVLYGDGQDDDLIGGYGLDWISGGTGDDGVLGDDGRIMTSRNVQAGTGGSDPMSEPLYGVLKVAQTDQFISTPGKIQQATINVSGALKKEVNLTPYSLVPAGQPDDPLFAPLGADDIIYGGLGNDFLHGGAGNDAMSGAEALPQFFNAPFNPGNVLRYGQRRAGEFAAYDEFDPLRKIFVDANGVPTGNGTGTPFLLNFDAKEGPLVSGSTTIHGDGNDVMFGDLGNDWLVGGTGRDHMYGGWGNDLLNADDDHDSTAGTADPTANNVPDTDASYEDTAYGGAGRDVLIANTGGDRLIDWVGEFNSYLVPFAPFGMGTVSRTLQPQLHDYLYNLSRSDGADPTRAADTGADPARNGEPDGEMGLVLQQDFAWQDQTGAPYDPQAGNLPGGKRDVLRSANFNAGTLDGFAPDSGIWAVANGVLQVSAADNNGDAVSVFNVDQVLPSYYEVQASINAGKAIGGWKADAFIIFDYQSKFDFKFAGVNVSLNKLQMGHRTAAGWIVDAQSNIQAKSDTFYNMLLAVNGTVATLSVNNVKSLTYTFSPRVVDGKQVGLNWGMVGVGSTQAQGSFDNVQAQRVPPPSTLDETEDFSDGYANRFLGGRTGTWTVTPLGRYDGTLPLNDDKAFSLINLQIGRGIVPASFLDLTAKLNTQAMGGIIFDQYGTNDFKFAVIDAPGDRVMLGHRTTKGWFIDATATTVINAGVDYTLQVTLKGTTASVLLNGSTVLGYAYNGVTVDGKFGVLTRGGRSSFDTFTLRTDDPACAGLPLPPGGTAAATSLDSPGGTSAATLAQPLSTSSATSLLTTTVAPSGSVTTISVSLQTLDATGVTTSERDDLVNGRKRGRTDKATTVPAILSAATLSRSLRNDWLTIPSR